MVLDARWMLSAAGLSFALRLRAAGREPSQSASRSVEEDRRARASGREIVLEAIPHRAERGKSKDNGVGRTPRNREL